MLRSVLLLGFLCLIACGVFGKAQAAPTKKVVFIAGKKSHGPGDHEYEKASRLLAHCLQHAANLKGYRAEVHLYGWPEDPKTLDDADCIVLYSDGSDHNERDHPLLIGDRLEVIGRQMKRGCGLVLIHYATFAPVKRGGPEYLEWVGGFFDYETGNTPNHWLSAIQFCEAHPTPASPQHPISRGLAPFDLREEYYYRMRFRDNDPRRVPILNVNLPNEPAPQTVAWAVARKDGGRGFAFTGGHPYTNFQNENVRRMLLNAIVWASRGEVPVGGVQSVVPENIDHLNALILTGLHHPAHDWRATTPALQEILGKDSRFHVTVWEDPERLATEDLSRYHLIIQNYCNWEKPSLSAKSREKLLGFVRNGGGLALIHFANGAWRDWPDYYGRLSRRIWVDGKSSHDAYGPFKAHITKPDHLLTQGLTDFDTTDELYCNQQGELPVDPLVTAHSKVSGKDEPLAFVYTEGKGRIFQTLMGHDANALRTPAHAELIRRACAWAARREVLPQALTPLPPSPEALGEGGNGPSPLPLRGRGVGVMRVAPGKFGQALDPRGAVIAAARPADFQPPMTVECWAKLNGKAGYNILVANHVKESSHHWEIFSDAGNGHFCAYLPGYAPARVDSPVDIVDGQWHYLAFQWHRNRAILYVDGKQVADEALTPLPPSPKASREGGDEGSPLPQRGRGAVPQAGTLGEGGPLWFGSYPPGSLGCDGLVDEVRISNYARAISQVPTAPLVLDRDTLGLWRFDAVEKGQVRDESNRANPAIAGGASAPVSSLPRTTLTRSNVPWPTVQAENSTDWPNVGNDKGGMRYAKLDQINRQNVKDLKVAWVYHTGDHDPNGNSTLECTPIVVEGVLYLTTVRMHIVALDAATGNELWRFDPKSGGVNRGVAYWSDGRPNGKRRIVVALSNGYMYSLDARSGELDKAFGTGGIVDLRQGLDRDISRFGYGASSAPAIYENLVIVGFLSSEVGPGAPGDVRAFDVRTGKEAWRFHTVPRPGEFGYDTWPPNSWVDRGGANAWSGMTVDAKNGIVFCGTGSAASDFYGADRIGANLFANCTLALDARTGKRLWHFQTLHHDLWDRDTPCPPVVCTVKQNGRTIEAVAQPTKTGFLFVFDRKTGKPLFPVEERPVPASDLPGEQASPTQPFPIKPPPFSRQEFADEDVSALTPESRDYLLGKIRGYQHGSGYHPPSLQGSVIIPGFHGGATWSGASFDPTTGLLYVNSNNTPWVATMVKDATLGYNFTGYNYFKDQNGYPAVKPPWGLLTAIDVSRGEFAWQITLGEFPELTAKGIPPTGTENFGGTIVTSGGLVFIGGTKDEKFHAFDSRTGKRLWEVRLPAGGYATPCTYMVNGKQYVVIACGGGGKLITKPGDAYVAFALPD